MGSKVTGGHFSQGDQGKTLRIRGICTETHIKRSQMHDEPGNVGVSLS